MRPICVFIAVSFCACNFPESGRIPGEEGVLEVGYPSEPFGENAVGLATGTTEVLTIAPVTGIFDDPDRLEHYMYLEATDFISSDPSLMTVEIEDSLFHDDLPILRPLVTTHEPGLVFLTVLGPEGEVVDRLPVVRTSTSRRPPSMKGAPVVRIPGVDVDRDQPARSDAPPRRDRSVGHPRLSGSPRRGRPRADHRGHAR